MYSDFYANFSSIVIAWSFWWVGLLLFQRIANRYPEKNTWKKDVILSLFQSVFVVISLPILAYFIKP
ncbi:hypothetical protein QWT69_00875 [Sporosarcina oncorhynchi]|uniref:Uncharacterized protein n=1 Tax=Sporosarcina oncorhynchi TaxID=3056444 RepID=A0ABZ0L664_9BACL|nr:hypothetical protein [Sporosarcina sp. T2O-4]WOV87707.1 hypothetical protein QWT69_00875 [Sporosarcina sp. T2O-4]